MKIEQELNYYWMLLIGIIIYTIMIILFMDNGINIKETNKKIFWGLQILFYYPFIQLLIYRIKRIKDLIKK